VYYSHLHVATWQHALEWLETFWHNSLCLGFRAPKPRNRNHAQESSLHGLHAFALFVKAAAAPVEETGPSNYGRQWRGSNAFKQYTTQTSVYILKHTITQLQLWSCSTLWYFDVLCSMTTLQNMSTESLLNTLSPSQDCLIGEPSNLLREEPLQKPNHLLINNWAWWNVEHKNSLCIQSIHLQEFNIHDPLSRPVNLQVAAVYVVRTWASKS